MPDLSRLTDTERQALRLLAQGHTAKSAATLLGATESAINERLREARRKTGVGSSRELARLVGPSEPSPKNWDEKIGVAEAPARPDTVASRKWPILLGASSMIALAAAVGAFAALSVSTAPAGPPRVIQTWPAVGAEIPAGKIAVKVTFDQPMRASWSFVVARDRASFPNCDAKPVQSKDGRSFTLACTVEAGKDYWIGFNNDRFRKFQSVSGVPAVPATLRFSAH
jgi:DNA-binding CsgD family transcriptional regulator